MALIEMMIYSFEADGPSESLAFDFLPFLALSSSICLFDGEGEREQTGVFVGGAGVVSRESDSGVSASISALFIAASRAAMASASIAVSVVVFVCTGLRISASERHLLGLEDFFAMTNVLWYLGLDI
jgi:hypothetical protein